MARFFFFQPIYRERIAGCRHPGDFSSGRGNAAFRQGRLPMGADQPAFGAADGRQTGNQAQWISYGGYGISASHGMAGQERRMHRKLAKQ